MGPGIGCQRPGDPREPIRRIAVGDNQYASVRQLVPEEVNGQLDEIVSIACHEAAAAPRGPFQMLIVTKRRQALFYRASCVDAVFSEYECDRWTEVRVEVVPHRSLRA